MSGYAKCQFCGRLVNVIKRSIDECLEIEDHDSPKERKDGLKELCLGGGNLIDEKN